MNKGKIVFNRLYSIDLESLLIRLKYIGYKRTKNDNIRVNFYDVTTNKYYYKYLNVYEKDYFNKSDLQLIEKVEVWED